MDSDEGLLLLLGIWLLSQYEGLPPLRELARKAAAKGYDALHKDAGTPQDTRRKKQWREAMPPVQRAAASFYDWLHNDPGHVQDLPGKQLTRQAVLDIATRAGFTNPKLAAAIALAESGGAPGIVKRSSKEVSVGLWQINTLRHRSYTVDDLKDPLKNAAAAFDISRGGTDWRAWTMFTNGHYREFMTGILAP